MFSVRCVATERSDSTKGNVPQPEAYGLHADERGVGEMYCIDEYLLSAPVVWCLHVYDTRLSLALASLTGRR